MDEYKERKVGCDEEEDAERERKLTIRQAEGTGDERIRRGNKASEEEVAREKAQEEGE